MNPKISVIMPVYNTKDYLVEALESILNQSFKDFEFIIVDDYSTD
ncbi:MAG: glycosyltransferase [Patescibacteria group bacterium]|nr:glycosyltransferase [Patescibacteria group bacterium]